MIQQGIDFFTANHLYRRADLYRQRFVYLRQQTLQMLTTQILKQLREANSQNNLRANQLTKQMQQDIKHKVFVMPRDPKSLQVLLKCLHDRCNVLEYSHQRNQIYAEYFDNRKYLLEQYLDGISFTYNAKVRVHEFLAAFLAKFNDIMQMESDYF
jgi:hypothetical protein